MPTASVSVSVAVGQTGPARSIVANLSHRSAEGRAATVRRLCPNTFRVFLDWDLLQRLRPHVLFWGIVSLLDQVHSLCFMQMSYHVGNVVQTDKVVWNDGVQALVRMARLVAAKVGAARFLALRLG